MAYTRQTWVDLTTILDAAAMTHLEDGIVANEAAASAAQATADSAASSAASAQTAAEDAQTAADAAQGDADTLDARTTSVENRVTALEQPTWTNLPYLSGWNQPHGAPFSYKKIGTTVYLRGRFAMDSGSMTQNTAYTVATLDASIRPQYTTGGMNVGNSANYVRIEISAGSGDMTIRPISGNVTWAAIDGIVYDTN